ncbi:MAG: hypothetical protein OEW33_07640, partial [Nitrospirota bacterium]|nr:hypothetical protein [Nitrospirota bacterium]
RDQSGVFSPLKSSLPTIPSADQNHFPDLESVLDYPDLVTFLESEGKGVNELENLIPITSISLLPLKGTEVEQAGIPNEQMAPSLQVLLAGGPGADVVQTKPSIKQPALPVLTGYSPIPAPFVGTSLADTSAPREPTTESAVGPAKNVGKPLDSVSIPFEDADMLLPRISPPPERASQGPLRPLVNQAFQSQIPFEETPAGLPDVIQASQIRLQYVNRVSSILGDVSGQGKESSMAIPSDVLGDSILSAMGDRSKDVVETTGKIVGVDPNGGQGVNTGMGGSTNSQPGFQPSSSSHSLGTSVRMAEERVPELPTPALQRLQMDVQLSETNRIQIDVGVQQRQVYAGLLMDHATLKNLAVQFIPQLEDQLAQVDMDLQEFSAEVRDQYGKQESETPSSWSGTQPEQWGFTTLPHASGSLPNTVKGVEEQGLHLVA